MQPFCARAPLAPRTAAMGSAPVAAVAALAAIALASPAALADGFAAASVVPPPSPSPSPSPGDGPAAAFPSGAGRSADARATSLGEELPQPFTIGAQPAWFLLGGVSSGATVAGADRGGYVGGELSLVRLVSGRSVGAYADAYYDFGQDSTYAGAGLELGWKILALDGGLASRFADDNDLGAAARLCATVGLFSLCGRYTHFWADRDADVFQIGALLKIPLISPLGDY